jgi:hypothetical protein
MLFSFQVRSVASKAPCLAVTVLLISGIGFSQELSGNPPSQPPTQIAQKNSAEQTKVPPSRTASTQILQQFNGELQDLVAKVSPAVVQIQVSGYGAIEGGNPSEAAVIARNRPLALG